MSTVTAVNFGTPEERQRTKLADALEQIAAHIRSGAMEYEPTGFVLALRSQANPHKFEILNVGVTADDIKSAGRWIGYGLTEKA